MRNFLRLFLAVPSLVLLAHGYVYECERGTDPTLCCLWNFQYGKNDTPPSVNIPSSVEKIRISKEQYYYARRLSIFVYDPVLHSTILRNPTSVQISNNYIGELHMPTDLQMGEFQNNWIRVVHTNSSLSYKVTYLDLMHNSIADISNFSALTTYRHSTSRATSLRR
ncbi:AGAP013186-PA-like protein [Anopheles sinensis]|uniref:AGAP013186-PA-like protein n=1 Tax=Anopheles sinensis TaxID=74873 RepID=A0A084VW26_ANOSI|nr:AGAP013186-PA-like protein [Anopheles sinensis]